jgi:SAM-dependent methyltransferase
MLVTHRDLDDFVRNADLAGGPNSPTIEDYWRDFKYQPRVVIDTSLDPDGEAYFAAMMSLYEELANRAFKPEVTELTEGVDIARLTQLESPYAFASSSQRALHYARLATAHRLSPADGGRALDMGCGWGLSSEFLAQLGYSVTAVDINPSFLELVGNRARRLGLNITARHSTFEEFVDEPASYDLALFYECFHHAARPRDVLARIAGLLKPAGTLLLVGEPVQSTWWPAWGLRLDALSVYCIRKFGWFECGWSSQYLASAVSSAGFVPVVHQSPDPAIGTIVVGHMTQRLKGDLLQAVANPAEWWFEGPLLVSNRAGRRSSLRIPGNARKQIVCTVYNHGIEPLDVSIQLGSAFMKRRLAPGGLNAVTIDGASGDGPDVELAFECTSWSPQSVLRNGDLRQLGFHLESIQLG